MTRRILFVVSLVLCMGIYASAQKVSYGSSKNSPIEADYWVGVDAWSGDVTYEIGGRVEQNGLVDHTHFPLSRLEWPISVAGVQVGGRLGSEVWDLRVSLSAAQSDDAGTMKDSDWEIPDAPRVLTTYSESDTELTAAQVDASLRYWVPFATSNTRERARLGGGVGMLYQDFDWTARNTEQWYPQNPELGHDYFAGDVITCEAQVFMPYLEVGGQLRYEQLFFEARAGFAPWMQVEDVDDHKLRYIRAETTSDGQGMFAEILARYTFSSGVFLQVCAWGMSFETDGTEEDFVYAGDDAGARWNIEHKVKSTQSRVTLSFGIAF